MFKRRIGAVLFTSLVLFAGCRKEPVALPVPKDKLVGVLVDVHLAEASIQDLIGQEKDSVADLYYEKIFELHGINRIDFDSTMAILRNDPWRSKVIYEEVLEELSEKEAQIQ